MALFLARPQAPEEKEVVWAPGEEQEEDLREGMEVVKEGTEVVREPWEDLPDVDPESPGYAPRSIAQHGQFSHSTHGRPSIAPHSTYARPCTGTRV
jgi:hypothetical protein